MRIPSTNHTETITNGILSDLSLREKHIIANMDEMDVEMLEGHLSVADSLRRTFDTNRSGIWYDGVQFGEQCGYPNKQK